jgi:hypothetical protein
MERLREDWFAAARPFDRDLDSVFPPAPVLEARHLRNCSVVPSRELLVRDCLPKGGVVAEVGTWRGHFAEVILRDAAPRELHLIDRTFEDFDDAPFRAAIESGRVRLHELDSVAALASFPDGYFDWIDIDADHRYSAVRADAWTAKAKVKDARGVAARILFAWVRRAVDELGLPPAAVGRIATLCWLHHSLSHVARREQLDVFAPDAVPPVHGMEHVAAAWLADEALGPEWDRWQQRDP